jgi:hypothetical protein
MVEQALQELDLEECVLARALMANMLKDGTGLLCRYNTDLFEAKTPADLRRVGAVSRKLQHRKVLRRIGSGLDVEFHAPLTVEAARTLRHSASLDPRLVAQNLNSK